MENVHVLDEPVSETIVQPTHHFILNNYLEKRS